MVHGVDGELYIAQRKVALATATSGIAATLLDNGRTVHSHIFVGGIPHTQFHYSL